MKNIVKGDVECVYFDRKLEIGNLGCIFNLNLKFEFEK